MDNTVDNVKYEVIEKLCLDYLWHYGEYNKATNKLNKSIHKFEVDEVLQKLKIEMLDIKIK